MNAFDRLGACAVMSFALTGLVACGTDDAGAQDPIQYQAVCIDAHTHRVIDPQQCDRNNDRFTWQYILMQQYLDMTQRNYRAFAPGAKVTVGRSTPPVATGRAATIQYDDWCGPADKRTWCGARVAPAGATPGGPRSSAGSAERKAAGKAAGAGMSTAIKPRSEQPRRIGPAANIRTNFKQPVYKPPPPVSRPYGR